MEYGIVATWIDYNSGSACENQINTWLNWIDHNNGGLGFEYLAFKQFFWFVAIIIGFEDLVFICFEWFYKTQFHIDNQKCSENKNENSLDWNWCCTVAVNCSLLLAPLHSIKFDVIVLK